MKALQVFKTELLPEAIKQRASQIPDNYSSKVDHVAIMINLINAEAKKLKSEEQVISAKRRQLELLVLEAEDELKNEMSSDGLCEISGDMIKFSLSPSPHKLIIEDESLVPVEYKREVVSIELRKDAIKDELKLGTVIPGCKLEQGQTLKLLAKKE